MSPDQNTAGREDSCVGECADDPCGWCICHGGTARADLGREASNPLEIGRHIQTIAFEALDEPLELAGLAPEVELPCGPSGLRRLEIDVRLAFDGFFDERPV